VVTERDAKPEANDEKAGVTPRACSALCSQ
jgi:hypothetical protein